MLILENQIEPQKNLLRPELSIFKQPFNQYSAVELQAHIQQRQDIKFFPVCDVEQCDPAFINDVLQNRFRFNNEVYRFGTNIPWQDNPSDDIEWLILLHKGYYLVGLGKLFRETGDERYQDKWIELIDSWIADVDDPGYIATDVTGRRIQNWIYAFYYFVKDKPCKPGSEDFLLRLLTSLEHQVNYLIKNLAVARNHRTLELYAIFLAAVVFPEFKKAEQWLSFSMNALAENADNDILADGVHCELSTFYHHIVVKNLLAVKRLAEVNQLSMPIQFDDAVRRALDFSVFIHKPDGKIPSLSDGDIDSFYDLLQLGYDLYGGQTLRYIFSQGKKGVPPGVMAKAFSSSGYYVLRSAWHSETEFFQDARYLVFDCGPLGAGNHGHLDVLNIEVAAYGRSLIVDPGRYTYDETGETNWRVLFRSTGYHNTVEVDGKNQVDYQYNEGKGKYKIQGEHTKAVVSSFLSVNDCHFLHGKVHSDEYTAVHERKIFFVSGEYWLISDILDDDILHQYALRYHLSPEAQDRTNIEQSDNLIIIDSPNLLLMHPYAQQSQIEIEAGFISTSYGHKSKAPIIKFQRSAKKTVFESVIFPYKQQRPEFILQQLHVEIAAEQKIAWATSAFSLTIQTPSKKVQDLFFISHDGTRRRWHYNNIVCTGQFCYIRLNSDGNVENFFTGPDSNIEIEGRLLAAQEVNS